MNKTSIKKEEMGGMKKGKEDGEEERLKVGRIEG